MPKLTMKSGLPASGKSTESKELLKEGNTIRLNRDLLRTMLHFDKFTGKNEGITVEAEQTLAKYFLTAGINVVVDDCNLNPKNKVMWETIAKETSSKFVHNHVATDWFECIDRDTKRENAVGSDVIKNMALQYGMVKFARGSVVICDLDGTLCDIKHRLHFVRGEEGDTEFKKDWPSFFAGISKDKLRKDVFDMIFDLYNQDKQIIFVSARPDTYKRETLKWLSKNGATFAFTLIMRKASDKRDDTEVKQDILNTYFPDKSCIYKVIDDRPKVLRMWQSNGLDVVDVGPGIEF